MKEVDHTKCRVCSIELTAENSYLFAAKKISTKCRSCFNIDRRPLRLRATRKRKQVVIDAYGGKCKCCDETEFTFLTIDHKNGGGLKHRKALGGSGSHLYTWLAQNNFPKKEYQLLCMNCNHAKGMYGKCPHKKGAK